MAYKYNEKTGEFEKVPDVTTRKAPARSRSSRDFWEGVGDLLLGILPYVIMFILIATCS
jgi:hypothetical protein